MSDYQVTNYGCCGECKYHIYGYVGIYGDYSCNNGESDYYGDFTDYTDTCEYFEQRGKGADQNRSGLAEDKREDMSDYIKKSDAIEALGERPLNWTDSESEIQEVFDYDMHLNAIKAIPSADVVEVVRCKDCKRGKPYSDKQLECNALGLGGLKFPNDYCSYGERRSDEVD